jgi:hypothetical protein
MDPISLILLGVALFGGTAAATRIAYLTIEDLMVWFRKRRRLLRSSRHIAATVLRLLNDGSYRTVQGIFNTASHSWVESRTLESDWVDADVADLHRATGRYVYSL